MSAEKEVVCFFVLFLTVYFLESIGGFYMTSAVVSIEKQFEIPSRISGLMVSAGDFGYIPSIVFVSYLGGKGNRAQWIGAGCLMIALANVLICSSNFLFPVKGVQINSKVIEVSLLKDSSRLSDSIVLGTFLDFAKNTSAVEDSLELGKTLPVDALNVTLREFADEHFPKCYGYNASLPLCRAFFEFLGHFNRPNVTELSNIRILAGSPFAFCYKTLNTLRRWIEAIRCSSGPSYIGPLIMIFGGLLILGVGRTMPYSLGLPLIDDNVRRQNLPIYFAGMFLIRILGPVLGFLIGSITNNYYYRFDVPPGLTPHDPMWIGRWWAGFLGIGIAMFGPSLALYLYPKFSKYLVGKNDYRNEKGKSNGLSSSPAAEMEPLHNKKAEEASAIKKRKDLALVDRHAARDETGRTVVPITVKEKIMDFISTVQTVLRIPVYVSCMIGRIMDVFAFKGFFVFLPKYLEVQFGLPQYKISLYMGIIGVSGFATGVVIGSVTMRKFKLQGRKAAGWVAVCSLVAALLTFLNSTVSCKSALSLIADKSRLINANFTTECNLACDCNSMPLYPVCNRQGQAFYSPCHAGCPLDQSLSDVSVAKTFRNCRCSNDTDPTVSRDFCDQSICERKFVLYLLNMAISGVFGGMGVIPAILILLRSVPPIDRSISLGFQGFLVSFFATLPSPVFWGWIIDKSCVLWNTVCGERSRGACALYDADKLRLTTHITYGIIRLTSLITDLAVFYFAKNLILMDEEEGEKGQEPEPVAEHGIIRKASHFASSRELVTDVVANAERKFAM